MEQSRLPIRALKEHLGKIFGGNEFAKIKQKNIDDFMEIVADYFYETLTTDVDKRQRNFSFKSKDTKSYFELGMDCIESGTNNVLLEMILSFVADTIIKEKSLTFQELFEIKILEKLILIIQQGDYKLFLLITNQLCSSEISSGIERKFAEKHFCY